MTNRWQRLACRFFVGACVTGSFALTPARWTSAAETFPVAVRIDAEKSLGPLKPIWRFFGADEPNYATMPNGEKLLGELGELGALRPDAVFFRTHNLLTTGDGKPALKWGSTNAYREDKSGAPIYDWTIVDGIFDTYRKRGVRPYVQIGFMPQDLSTKPDPYQHRWTPTADYSEIYTGWAYPPKSYEKWSELVYQWAKHCVDRYGEDEVATWYWETWNEANIPYWQGTPEEFRKLHDFAIAGVRRAIPNAKVGGPDSAGSGGQFTRDFLEHCLRGENFATGEVGTPLDFISFHAKGAPRFIEDDDDGHSGGDDSGGDETGGHVRMGIAEQLRTVDDGFKLVASFPELKSKPIVIGESDPEGCAACQGPQLAYRNGTMYSSYTAASFARKHELAARRGVNLEGALTWAFEFEDQKYFAGFRSLATNGIDKPVLNVFRMFAKMRGDQLAVESDGAVPLDAIMRRGVRDKPDVAGFASRDGNKVYVMLWHYHDDDLAGPAADIELSLENLPIASGEATIEHFTIDADHSNGYAAWKKMGSPQQPTPAQYSELELAAQLAPAAELAPVKVASSAAALKLTLPRQAVSLLVLDVGTGS
jgi:xylan 1,4-beta-xylosidase